MKNKKGFTLVELLAVIVILVVLVLLAVPNIIKMLDDAKRNAFEVEAERIVDGAKKAYAENALSYTERTVCLSLNDIQYTLNKDLSIYEGSVLIDIDNSNHQIFLTDGNYMVDVKNNYSGSLKIVQYDSSIQNINNCLNLGK